MKVAALPGCPTQGLSAVSSSNPWDVGFNILLKTVLYSRMGMYKSKNSDYNPKDQEVKAAFINFVWLLLIYCTDSSFMSLAWDFYSSNYKKNKNHLFERTSKGSFSFTFYYIFSE